MTSRDDAGQSALELGYLIQIMDCFRAYDTAMPIPTAQVFLQVAMKQGITKREIEDNLGLSTSSSSRHILMLTKEGDQARIARPGFDLVFTSVDPLDRKSKQIFLTSKGRKLANQVTRILENYYNAHPPKG